MNREEWDRLMKSRDKSAKSKKDKEGDDMPAVSKKQRKAMAIAEHAPEKLFKRNKGLKKMTKNQLSDFASTKEKGLPAKKGKSKKVKKMDRKESMASFFARRNKETGKGRR